MKNLVVLFCLWMAKASNANEPQKFVFSVRINGTLICHDKPMQHVRLDIYDDANMMNYPKFYDRFPDKHGAFDLSAYIYTEQYTITPFIVLTHDCWEDLEVEHNCKRKLVIPIPANRITHGKEPDENKIFDLANFELKFKSDFEVIGVCG